jgi:DNA-binding GntR family transcriptional regulator
MADADRRTTELALPPTRGEAIYEILRERILSGTLLPGQRLKASGLAAELGVSAIPVREALNRLRADAFVTIEPHKGAFVSAIPKEDLIEYLEIRLRLECLAIEKAVPQLGDGDIEELEVLVKDLDKSLSLHDWLSYAGLNRTFHQRVYHASNSTILVNEIDRLFSLTERGNALFSMNLTYVEKSQQEHRAILAALRDRDTPKLVRLMHSHRQRNITTLERVTPSGSN